MRIAAEYAVISDTHAGGVITNSNQDWRSGLIVTTFDQMR
jgi:hypothetical protein